MIVVSSDPRRLDRDLIHRFLSGEAYWSKGIPRDVLERAIDGSIPFGAYDGEEQVGFARAVTDRATFAYLADVFVLESHRGRGVGKLLVEAALAHEDLQGLRRWMLMTRDAHGLYAQYDFKPLAAPERAMERHDPGVYAKVPG